MGRVLKVQEPYNYKKERCIIFSLTNHIPRAELESFCRKNHIIKMSLFGSVLRDELKPDSDILVEFDKYHMPGLFNISRVDLRAPEDLSRYFRDEKSSYTVYLDINYHIV